MTYPAVKEFNADVKESNLIGEWGTEGSPNRLNDGKKSIVTPRQAIRDGWGFMQATAAGILPYHFQNRQIFDTVGLHYLVCNTGILS
jgi:hypothetical protein